MKCGCFANLCKDNYSEEKLWLLRKDEVSVSIKLSVKLQRMKNNQNYDRGGLKSGNEWQQGPFLFFKFH